MKSGRQISDCLKKYWIFDSSFADSGGMAWMKIYLAIAAHTSYTINYWFIRKKRVIACSV